MGLALVSTSNEIAADFDTFWLLYPKRMARKEARRAWDRLSAADQLAAIVGLAAWRRVWLARGEMQYVPHAATWINGERWTDELPVEVTSSHASHQVVTTKAGERGEMPQSVKDLIAKLKGGR